MSEIADAVQIIRVTYDGIEIAMKMGSASIQSMQKALDLIVGMLEHEKEMGKTNLKGLLAKGGDIQVLSFADEDLKKFRKLAKKYGILYSEMPDADRKDGLTEVMFHSEAAPRIRMMSQKLQDGRVWGMDEYLKSGNEEFRTFRRLFIVSVLLLLQLLFPLPEFFRQKRNLFLQTFILRRFLCVFCFCLPVCLIYPF